MNKSNLVFYIGVILLSSSMILAAFTDFVSSEMFVIGFFLIIVGGVLAIYESKKIKTMDESLR